MDYERYLKLNKYSWKDFIVFSIDENKSVEDIIDSMTDDGLIDKLYGELKDGLLDYIVNKVKQAK